MSSSTANSAYADMNSMLILFFAYICALPEFNAQLNICNIERVRLLEWIWTRHCLLCAVFCSVFRRRQRSARSHSRILLSSRRHIWYSRNWKAARCRRPCMLRSQSTPKVCRFSVSNQTHVSRFCTTTAPDRS